MITVFGSLNADLFFTVERLPERGETVLAPSVVHQPGGKGANQAAAAARAGAATRFVGCIGEDGLGERVLDALRAAGCDVACVRQVPGATGMAAVMVEQSGENQIVVGSGANLAVTADQLDAVAFGAGDTLVCQMEVSVEATAAALERARTRGARTVLNLAPARALAAETLATVDVLVLNEGEAAVLAGDQAAPLDAARRLAAAHDLACIVTLGGDGAIAVAPGGEGWQVGSLAIEAVDTVGAGDAFVGVLAAALDRGATLEEALHRASVGAGLACTRPGAMAALPDAAAIDGRLSALALPVHLGHG